jgi:hypothetical protein
LAFRRHQVMGNYGIALFRAGDILNARRALNRAIQV